MYLLRYDAFLDNCHGVLYLYTFLRLRQSVITRSQVIWFVLLFMENLKPYCRLSQHLYSPKHNRLKDQDILKFHEKKPFSIQHCIQVCISPRSL